MFELLIGRKINKLMLKVLRKFKYIVAVMAILMVSCQPPAKPKCIIIVSDINGDKVIGATVTLSAPGSEIEVAPKTSGSDGKAHFEFENPVIMNVDVIKDGASGSELVKLIEDEVTSVEVTITL
jgi:hypothetical protein